MFRGDTSLNLDVKGRLAVPSRYRERLLDACGGSLIITVSPAAISSERYLMVYPSPAWNEIEEKIQRLPTFNRNAQRLRHKLIGRASECDMDGNGRVLVPPVLREWAGLKKRVRMIGMINRFELWDEEVWLNYNDEDDADMAELADSSDLFGDLSL